MDIHILFFILVVILVVILIMLNFSKLYYTPNCPVMLVLGDSISSEHGLPSGAGWVALLAQEKFSCKIENASISGETTSGGRDRLPALLQQHQPDIVIIQLGGNDVLEGYPLDIAKENLQFMIDACQSTNAKVLLLGMHAPPKYEADYHAEFSHVFIDLSKTNKTGVVPFLMEGVADAVWFQSDLIHPNAAAQPHILNNVLPELNKLILSFKPNQ